MNSIHSQNQREDMPQNSDLNIVSSNYKLQQPCATPTRGKSIR